MKSKTQHFPPIVPFTAFPNVLLDRVMPSLKDTEWRVLCIIVRQTKGWKDPISGRRKQTDWLTHGQLKRRTGRASAAICQAIDSLVRQELIQVKDGSGRSLHSPLERRRQGSVLYYGLNSRILQAKNDLYPVKES
jgi:hypothetical protein